MATTPPSNSSISGENPEDALSLDLELSTIPIGDTTEETPVVSPDIPEEAAVLEEAEAEISLESIQETAPPHQTPAVLEENGASKQRRQSAWIWAGAVLVCLLVLCVGTGGLWFYLSRHTENIPAESKLLEPPTEEVKTADVEAIPSRDASTIQIPSPAPQPIEPLKQAAEPLHNTEASSLSPAAMKSLAKPTPQNDSTGLNCQLSDRQTIKESLRKCLKGAN